MAAGEFRAGVRENYRPEMRENMDITAKAHKIARKAVWSHDFDRPYAISDLAPEFREIAGEKGQDFTIAAAEALEVAL